MTTLNPTPKMSRFERNLTWWVLGCIVVGILLGKLAPAFFHAIAQIKMAEVNLTVALLIWLMIIPMLLKVDFSAKCQVPSAKCQVPSAKCQVPSAKCQVPSAKCQVPSAGAF